MTMDLGEFGKHSVAKTLEGVETIQSAKPVAFDGVENMLVSATNHAINAAKNPFVSSFQNPVASTKQQGHGIDR